MTVEFDDIAKVQKRIMLYRMAQIGLAIFGDFFLDTLACVQIDRQFEELCQ